ncbi:MAG: hypothetical protein J5I92_12760, partial [Thiogranum sp.]|nr:hypothetical protein [Thiogranum sp.]
MQKPLIRLLAGLVCLIATQTVSLPDATAAADADDPGAAQTATTLDDASCLGCHGGKEELTVADEEGETRPLMAIDEHKYSRGVHSDMACVDCHREIVDSQAAHQKSAEPKPDCVTCHEALWET